ncbi:hypothetical protein [Brasilonema bromeliae]|uniref:Uncharacterized protein n=1 Tax=Brasilonema bromeliae SPC951 TaxID=385972 RepID=A0ABX1P7A5_9CYAN|nr:hypothetical protein [Brasilonema bromeliae]NMG19913.1 hypothetical protein [Brasilonema bromeliae SPC951]
MSLVQPLPDNLKQGDEVKVLMTPISPKYSFPTLKLGIKEEYLSKEKIYEPEEHWRRGNNEAFADT